MRAVRPAPISRTKTKAMASASFPIRRQIRNVSVPSRRVRTDTTKEALIAIASRLLGVVLAFEYILLPCMEPIYDNSKGRCSENINERCHVYELNNISAS